MPIRRYLFILIMLSILSAHGKPAVTLAVHHLPAPVVIDGKPVIYYELWITSSLQKALILNRLTLINKVNTAAVATFTAEDLKQRYAPLGASTQGQVLAPNGNGLIYIEVTLPKGQSMSTLTHKLEVMEADTQKALIIQGGDIALPAHAPIVLGQPLRGGPWAAIYDAAWVRGHRRVTYSVNDTTRIPGRFAIDFMMLGKDAALTKGDEDSVANWYGYAADVLAVSDGVVAAVVNDFPESPTLSGHPNHPADKAAGNYVALDIGGGRYVFYEHLKPGSATVKPGQRVKKGERIAALGYTGHTTGPHLHLHVADRNASLGAEGLPYALESYILKGTYILDPSQGKRQIPVATEKPPIKNERPAPQAIIVFQDNL